MYSNRQMRTTSRTRRRALCAVAGSFVCSCLLLAHLGGLVGNGLAGSLPTTSILSASSSQGPATATHPHLGLLTLPPSTTSVARHPIETLISEAAAKYEQIQAKKKSVGTLRDAVEDYRERWGMDPPRGFDAWYSFSVDHNTTTAPSLIPLSHESFRTFLSLPPPIIHERIKKEAIDSGQQYVYAIEFLRNLDGQSGSMVNISSPTNRATDWSWAPKHARALMQPIAHLVPAPLPGDPNTLIAASVEDAPRRLTAWELMNKARDLSDKGEVWDRKDLLEWEWKYNQKHGWRSSCPPDSPYRSDPPGNYEPGADVKEVFPARADWNVDGPKSWVRDRMVYTDFCENKDFGSLHSTLLGDSWRGSGPLLPIMVQARVATSTDFIWTPTLSTDHTADHIPWARKTDPRLFWRGTPTGMIHGEDTPWRAMQRHRINYLAHNATGTREVLAPQQLGRVANWFKPRYALEDWDVKDLARRYLDVGLVGGPYFCRKEDGSCEIQRTQVAWLERVSPEEAANYRYILDMDGHSWSQRFRRELSSGSAVLKSSLHHEWHSSLLIPWYHYIPIKIDFSDLFDTMAFFQGSPDGSTPGRDDLAEKIGARGREFAVHEWRTEDMQSFTLLMLLEYQRMWSNDRKAASFEL